MRLSDGVGLLVSGYELRVLAAQFHDLFLRILQLTRRFPSHLFLFLISPSPDFWMENGVLRDVHTHLPANTTWWEIVANPHRPYPSLEGYTSPAEPERNYHCTYDMVDSDGLAQGCQPRKVISFERLLDHTTGPAEGAKLAAALENNLNVDLIAEEARECIWRELIVRDVADVRHNRRDQAAPIEDYMFTLPQMNAIVAQLDRMLAKYTQGAWLTTPTAQDLVSNLQEYKFEVEKDIAMALHE